VLRLTDAALAHLRADLDRTATEQPKSGRIPLTVRELGGLLARLDAAEGACRALLEGGDTLTALGLWVDSKTPFNEGRTA
jgi:hypothetical protein